MGTTFNPNLPCIPNGNIFSFPFTEEEAKIILMPIPWDVTASYKTGSSLAPQAILDASLQLDFFDKDFNETWKIPVFMLPISNETITLNNQTRLVAEKIIDYLSGNFLNQQESTHYKNLIYVNNILNNFHESNYLKAKKYLENDKIPCFLGGEHSIAWGLIKAISEKTSFSILHIDAHADLRADYEGFAHSHASIMYNVSKFSNIEKFVHVAIRDYCLEENNFINSNTQRHILYTDKDIYNRLFQNESWHSIASEIISNLTDKVYISLDIDGLEPSNCPNTGTPVAGGLSYNQTIYLLYLLRKSGKKVISFDLSEVAPDNSPKNIIDASVGARILLELLKTITETNKLI